MIEEFDKEMDFLLRQTAQSEIVFSSENPKSEIRNPKSVHLDADEISAFAENALPQKIRQNYVLHLADCERCRKNLVTVLRLNDAAESEIIHAEESATAVISNTDAPQIPWYQKLFAVPKLAYAMGALILLLAGVGIFTVLQNDSRSAGVSQISERQMGGGKGMSSDGDAPMQETSSRSMSNAAVNSAAATDTEAKSAISSNSTAANVPNQAMAANSNTMMTQREASRALTEPERLAKPSATFDQPAEKAKTDSVAGSAPPPPPAPAKAENNYQVDGQAQESPTNLAQNQIGQNQTQITPDTRNARRPPMPAAKMRSRQDSSLEDSQDDKEKSAEAMNIGGKIFKRAANVWVDAAYRGQPTTNISRGTNEYKKLDSGLRGIVENLGGTVIIVWKNKAYRIQ